MGKRSSLILLRLGIGWHFLYEGLVKIFNPTWTAKGYLLDAAGPFKGFFEWIANNSAILAVSDFLNAWGLSLIGLSLIIGWLSRYAALAGMALLGLYYLSHPAWPGLDYIFPSDGSYFIINKTLIELFALYVVFAWPTDGILGLERLFKKQ